jgi:hypothetical protein
MKYIKLFEKKEKMIELIGYPEGNIIRVTEDELEVFFLFLIGIYPIFICF